MALRPPFFSLARSMKPIGSSSTGTTT